MKNKEEPSANSQRGNASRQVDLYRSDDVGRETTRSPSRPGGTVAARAEQPALGLFPGFLTTAGIAVSSTEPALPILLGKQPSILCRTAQCRPARCGGVGAAVSNGRGYPISWLLFITLSGSTDHDAT
jgi:hypothetical protein